MHATLQLSSESKVKGEMLNDFFSTVFTREDEKDTPVLNPLCDAKLVDIDDSVDIITVRSKLSGAVYCNQSCLWVCLFVVGGWCGSVTMITQNCVH